MSDFKDLYKNVNQLKEQQINRRLQLLEDQRRQREDNFSAGRDLKEFISSQSRKKYRANPLFKHALMLSEWMMVRPDDIEDFILVPCPKGIRCTLSTGENRRQTAMLYYKNGTKFKEFKTNIPSYTIIDCIYDKHTEILYFLDVIGYSGRDLVHCDTSFRFFWLKSRFVEDNPQVTEKESTLTLALVSTFDMSDSFSCRACFQKSSHFPEDTELDGFLFYHKDCSYTAGQTPLVLWLFPFMVDELFDEYQINSRYIRPENYTNYLDFIKDFDEKLLKKKKPNQKATAEPMDAHDDDSRDETQAMIDLEMAGDDV